MCSHASTHGVCAQPAVQGILVCRMGATDNHTDHIRTQTHRFSTAGTKRAREVLRERDRQEERQFLHHQDSRINLNRWTLQHCPANSTNGLFQRRRTCTHAWTHTHTPLTQIRDEVPLSFASLARSPELSKNTKQACSNNCLCRHTQATVGRAGWSR